jgi:hypothetical protein
VELSLNLKTDTYAVTAYLAALQPNIQRLEAHDAAAAPTGPVASMLLALEDLVEGIVDTNLMTAVETETVDASVRVTFIPSPVAQHLGDLIGAICDALDARAQDGAA